MKLNVNRTGMNLLFAVAVAAMTATGALAPSPAQAASEIKAVVNGAPITSYDISRRANFLKLQRQSGNLQQKARDQLVEEALKLQEIDRLGARVSEAQVEAAFQRFASSNKMSKAQLSQILAKAGVGADHFRNYIRIQMSWPRVVKARYGSSDRMSTEDLVSKMLEQGGEKPTTTEYFLQQVIFVVPASRRNAILGARRREAEAMRSRFPGCASSRQYATSLRDVSVQDLGRVLAPNLPGRWKPLVEKTSEGSTTQVVTTDRGVEFIAVCKAKKVSDDFAAETVFLSQDNESSDIAANSEKYLKDLRRRSSVINR